MLSRRITFCPIIFIYHRRWRRRRLAREKRLKTYSRSRRGKGSQRVTPDRKEVMPLETQSMRYPPLLPLLKENRDISLDLRVVPRNNHTQIYNTYCCSLNGMVLALCVSKGTVLWHVIQCRLWSNMRDTKLNFLTSKPNCLSEKGSTSLTENTVIYFPTFSSVYCRSALKQNRSVLTKILGDTHREKEGRIRFKWT